MLVVFQIFGLYNFLRADFSIKQLPEQATSKYSKINTSVLVSHQETET